MKKFVLKTDRLVLRPLKLKDLDTALPNINDSLQTRFLTFDPPMSRQKETKWIKNTWKEWKHGIGFVFAAVLKETDEMIGTVDLRSVNKTHKKAGLGIFIYKKHWENGFGTEAVKALLKFGFEKLKLNRIEYGFIAKNTRSKNLMKGLGFKIEGIQRQWFFKRGRFWDHAFGSILKSEWKKNV